MQHRPAIGSRLAILAILASFAASTSLFAQQPTVQVGKAAEVRDGGNWVSVSIVSQKGKLFEVRYANGTTKWVSADRLRPQGAKATPAPVPDQPAAAGPAPGKPATAPDQASRPISRYQIGESVEFKRGDAWITGKIRDKTGVGGEFILVGEGDSMDFGLWEWMYDDRIRKLGEAKEGPAAADQVGVKFKNSMPSELANQRAALAEKKRKESLPPAEVVKYEAGDLTSVTPIAFPTVAEWNYTPVAQRELPVGALRVPPEMTSLSFGQAQLVGGSLLANFGDRVRLQMVDTFMPPNSTEFRVLPPSSEDRLTSISPDGKLAVFVGMRPDTDDKLQIFDVEAGAFQRVGTLLPIPAMAETDWVREAFIVGDGSKVAVFNSGQELRIWDWKHKKLLHSATLPDAKRAFNATGSAVAFADQFSLRLLDLAAGRISGAIQIPIQYAKDLKFSPSGKTLFISDSTRMIAVDTASGKIRTDLGISRGFESFVALSDSRVALVEAIIVDVDAKATVGASLRERELQMFHTPSGQRVRVKRDAFTVEPFISPEFEQAIAKRPAKPPLLSAGDTVNVRFAFDNVEEKTAKKLESDFRQSILNAGYKIGPSKSEILFVRTPSFKNDRPVRMRDGREVRVNVDPHDFKVVITQDRAAIFEQSCSITGYAANAESDAQGELNKRFQEQLDQAGKLPLPTAIVDSRDEHPSPVQAVRAGGTSVK